MPADIILAWSGGKDSTLVLAALTAERRGCVAALLTTVTAGYERISVHGVRRELLHAQAAALGLPLAEVVIPQRASNEEYELAMASALALLGHNTPSANTVAFGDLFLRDVRDYRERQFAILGRPLLFPLWGRDTTALAAEFIARGFKAVLVCVDTHVLPAEFAGRPYDASLLRDLPASVDPCGENGEFHTFVTDGPLFATPVRCETGQVVLREERFAYCELAPLAN